jgi:hypothetical protein
MFLPPFKRLSVEDFKDQTKWIAKLLFPINQVFLSLANGLQHGITFKDNIACQIQIVSFNNNSTELSPTHPIKFLLTSLNTAPVGLWLVSAVDSSAVPQALTTAPFATWNYNSQSRQIYITAVSGLVAGQAYRLTFIII